MNRILVVEDEKLIRQGIIVMIQRSGIEVSSVLSAKNGEEALLILEENEIDLVFTDIKMPKMDGIELVKAITEKYNDPPVIVVVSGFDDFSYAVEMLRNGVRDYLLKPVERTKMLTLLEQVDNEINQKKLNRKGHEQAYLQTLRTLINEDDINTDDFNVLKEQVKNNFISGEYIGVYCKNALKSDYSDLITMQESNNINFYLTNKVNKEKIMSEADGAMGLSKSHAGIENIKECYKQSVDAYKNAFFKDSKIKAVEYASENTLHESEFKSDKFDKEAMQIANLLGQSQSKEAFHMVEEQINSVKRGKTAPDRAAAFVSAAIEQIDKNYQSILSVDNIKEFSNIWCFNSADDFLEQLFEWFESFSGRLSKEFEDFQNKQKIRNAVIYIQDNFKRPLNMAMVSNEVSMNYSLFSYLFKQYVGSNFVNHLQELRINEAKKLLVQTEMRVNEIGKRVGFTDEKNFLKVFKAIAGVSPSEFRKMEQAAL